MKSSRVFRGFGLGLMRRLRGTPPGEADQVIAECRRLGANANFWDIGANVGDVSSALVGHARQILAVEPDPLVFASLKKRLEGKATCIEALVGPQGAERVFVANGLASTSSTSLAPGDTPPNEYVRPLPMRAVSLDQLAAEHGWPDLIKIDVEGYEMAVLESGPAVLARRPTVILEFNSVCLANFGRINPRDAIERLMALFPRLDLLTPAGRERVTDPYVFVYHNILTHGSVNNLVGSWG